MKKKREDIMSNLKKFLGLVGPWVLVGLITGCGTAKKMESADMPGKPTLGQASPASKTAGTRMGHYVVKSHDCLWEIAGKPGIYGDSFQWPELFKANRDAIKDPDLIYPRQDLRVDRDYSSEERAQAKRTAMATPKFVPHSKPRETLPVDYF